MVLRRPTILYMARYSSSLLLPGLLRSFISSFSSLTASLLFLSFWRLRYSLTLVAMISIWNFEGGFALEPFTPMIRIIISPD